MMISVCKWSVLHTSESLEVNAFDGFEQRLKAKSSWFVGERAERDPDGSTQTSQEVMILQEKAFKMTE